MSEDRIDSLSILLYKLRYARMPSTIQHAVRNLPTMVRAFRPNQDIIYEGSPSAYCCIVLAGWVGCYQTLEGRRQIVAIHIPGDAPDLQSLHLPKPDFGMLALMPASVAFVRHTDLRQLISDFPVLATVLWRETLLVAAVHRAWMTGLGRRNSLSRLAHFFCEMYLRLEAVGLAKDHSMPMPLRQHDLADALGQTVVHINRMLQEMRKSGLIELQSRRLTIHNWPGLIAIAEFDPNYLHLNI